MYQERSTITYNTLMVGEPRIQILNTAVTCNLALFKCNIILTLLIHNFTNASLKLESDQNDCLEPFGKINYVDLFSKVGGAGSSEAQFFHRKGCVSKRNLLSKIQNELI